MALDYTVAVEWQLLGQPKFDELVEAIVHRKYGASATVAVNGRGGDGGIDILVVDGEETIIYQLKYYVDGFSGGHAKSRRPQITRSYHKAMNHRPTQWVLVYPNTPSLQHINPLPTYVAALKADVGH